MDRKLRIGITERGDAGLDLSWAHRLSAMDGAILITKNLNDRFRQALLDEYHDRHGVVFETCAEPALTGDAVRRTGCMSAVDLNEMGLPVPDAGTNPPRVAAAACACPARPNF